MINAEHALAETQPSSPERKETLGTAIYSMGQLQNKLETHSRRIPARLDERLLAQQAQNISMADALSQANQTPIHPVTPLNSNAAPFRTSLRQAQQCNHHIDYATDRESDWDSQGYYIGTDEYPRLSREDYRFMTGESSSGDPGTTSAPVPAGSGANPTSLCTLCKLPFTKGETVGRLRCRHMFHRKCYDNIFEFHTVHIENPIGIEIPCPICHELGHIISTWRYIPSWSTDDGRIRIEPRNHMPVSSSTAVQTVRTGTRGKGQQCRPPGSASSSGTVSVVMVGNPYQVLPPTRLGKPAPETDRSLALPFLKLLHPLLSQEYVGDQPA